MTHFGEVNRGIAGELIHLVVPLLIGNIFQQFYNIASTMIVGHFLGQAAFAALGAAGSVMNLYRCRIMQCRPGGACPRRGWRPEGPF